MGTAESSSSGTPGTDTTGASAADSDTSNATSSPATTSTPTEPTGGSSESSGSGSSGSSTGDPMLCGITDDPEATGPWFRLTNGGNAVTSGASIAMECGGQGSLMFYLASEQGGFLPEGEVVYYAVTMDVAGFDDLSPSGHFFQDLNYGLGVGCGFADEADGGFSLSGIAVLPPDALLDVSTIDGAAATLHVEMLPPGAAPVVLDADLTLVVDPSLTTETCGFG